MMYFYGFFRRTGTPGNALGSHIRLRRDDRRNAAIPLLFSLHRDDVGVSRRREMKKCLRRDARVG